MQARSALTLVVCFVIGLAGASAQAPALSSNQITVLGSIELKRMADRAWFSFSVKGTGESLQKAVADADSRTKFIIDKLLAMGIAKEGVSTSQFYSGENAGDKAFLSSSRDYMALLTTVVQVDSLENLRSALFLVSESKPQTVSQINFSLRDQLTVRKQARIDAALKAKEKATEIAGALGVSLGKVVSIEETMPTQVHNGQNPTGYLSGYSSPFNPSESDIRWQKSSVMFREAIDETRGGSFFAQTISVTSQIRVVFEIK
jgi:uncharacterized protein